MLFLAPIAAVLFNQSVLREIGWWLRFVLVFGMIRTRSVAKFLLVDDPPVVLAFLALACAAGFVCIAAALIPSSVETDAGVTEAAVTY